MSLMDELWMYWLSGIGCYNDYKYYLKQDFIPNAKAEVDFYLK